MTTLNLQVPTCHQELSQKQLRYLYFVISSGYTPDAIRTMCLMRWAQADIHADEPGVWLVKVDGSQGVRISDQQIAEVLPLMDWVLNIPVYPVRLNEIQNCKCLYDHLMSGLTFENYMMLENLYQGYLHTKNTRLLDRMAAVLYGIDHDLLPEEQYNVFSWFAAIKQMLSRRYTFLFHASPVDNQQQEDMNEIHKRLLKQMDIQIRALTKGDITKEAAIMQSDYQSALRELNAQAEEYEEIKKTTSKS